MIIYIDENLPTVLTEALNLLQKPENFSLSKKNKIEVRSIKKEFGAGALDEEWIPKVGIEGACVITQDYNIHRIKHQKVLCEKYNLGMFYFRPPSKKGFSYWDMVKLLIKHWPERTKVATKKRRPFSYKVTARSTKLEEMK